MTLWPIAVRQVAGYVPTARTVTTTAPLTGGGDLSANRTLDVSTFTTAARGVVPAPGTATGRYLKDDGTWAAVTAPAKVTHATANLSGGGAVINGETRYIGTLTIPGALYARRVFLTCVFGITGSAGPGMIIPILQIGGAEVSRSPNQDYSVKFAGGIYQQATLTASVDCTGDGANKFLDIVIYNGGVTINVSCRADAIIMPT